MILDTENEMFSPLRADRGTVCMLEFAEFRAGDKVLDLGCGYGLVGIYAAKIVGEENVVMSDISRREVEVSLANAAKNGVGRIRAFASDGFSEIPPMKFDAILSNPPYHVDFSVPKHFIEKSFYRLHLGGRLYMVTRRKLWYQNRIAAVFGGVRVEEKEGYYIFIAEKRSPKPPARTEKKTNGLSKKLARKEQHKKR